MNINSFDKSNIKSLREDINAALAEVGKKYGISLQAGNASFTATETTFKLLAMVGNKTISDVRAEKTASDLVTYATIYFPDLKLSATYSRGGRTYKIVGYNTRRRTAPLIIVDTKTDKKYKISIDDMRAARVVG